MSMFHNVKSLRGEKSIRITELERTQIPSKKKTPLCKIDHYQNALSPKT